MIDRMSARRAFLRECPASRIRRLAACLESICERLADAGDAVVVREKIDEVMWMIEWAVPGETRDVQAELVDLQHALVGWRAVGPNAPDRAIARDRACAWAERLLWLSALLEATE